MRKKQTCLLFSFLLLVSAALVFLLPTVAAAKEASFYQAGLAPAESHLTVTLQELSRNGEYKQGLQEFAAFAKGSGGQDKDLPPLLGFMAANLNFQIGNYRKSATLYRRVVKKAPEFYQAYENYGMALLLAEDYKLAAKVLLQAAALLPEKAHKLRYRAAIAALYAGDLKQARSLLIELTLPSPEAPLPPPAAWLKALIQIHWQLEEVNAAVGVSERLVDYYPEVIGHWRLYGQVALAAKAWRKALSAYKVLQIKGDVSVKERKLIAIIYQQLELYQEAAETLEGVFAEVEPQETDLKRLLSLYRQTGQVDNALKILSRRQKLNPDSMNLFQQGEILYSAGRYREAGKIFLALDKISKDDGHQYLLAGYCAWNLNDFSAAARAWEKAAKYPTWRKRALDLLQTLKPLLETENSDAARLKK